ncbi:hypothetical protein KC363_g8424 [Hortaea werneckii]|uniref:Uncharacterized protein n=1 Tax=Hortaea werneckii TaxID=91943 RepID=A0A3M7F1G4_HORWE|nr:hypothetical protein KC363_g8424 [Hortaea werneckii]RMY82396.1 hypothetical protein D0861_07912 [Hortaea werneckii]
MDGQSSMDAYQPQDVEMQEEDTEDFYGSEDASQETKQQQDASVNLLNMLMPQEEHEHNQPTPPPAQTETPPTQTPQPMTADEQKKAENKRKTELLRAKLIAQRQNTPKKAAPVAAASRPETPAKQQPPQSSQPPPSQTQHTPDQRPSSNLKPIQNTQNAQNMNGSGDDALGVDALLAEGKAAAEKAANKLNGFQPAENSQSPAPAKPPPNPPTAFSAPRSSHPLATSRLNRDSSPSSAQTKPSHPPTSNLADPYYADLSAWLEFTGYHDTTYRSSKLSKHHERRVLEAEVARIHERLEKLKQDEQAEMEALRASISHPVSSSTAPPLPAELPKSDHEGGSRPTHATNGVKRPRSPDQSPHPSATAKNEKLPRLYPPCQESNNSPPGFRIRGANDSPSDSIHRPPPAATSTRRPSFPLERRPSYSHVGDPRGRRSSLDYGDDDCAPRSRDPSLERRQAYYQPTSSSHWDSERGGLPPSHLSFSSAPTVAGAGRYDSYTPRDLPPPSRFGGGAGGKERGGGPRSASGGRRGFKEGYSSYGGGVGRKGGR